MPFDLTTAMQERADQGLLRKRQVLQSAQAREIQIDGRAYLNFSSNDYLGLASDPQVTEFWRSALSRWGAGSGASPLVTGYSEAHESLETLIAEWLGVEAVMLFSTGFAANQAIIKALLEKKHTQWHDRLNHASLQEAGSQSPARMRRFQHNDMTQLSSLLEPEAGLIISEGVFSMDGDQAPCRQLADLAKSSGNWLMLDDAHGIGVLGQAGQGTLSHQDVAASDVHIRMATFGKAIGMAGAFIAGSRALIHYLINFSRDYVYSTHMPPAQAAAIADVIRLVQQADDKRDHLQALIRLFRQRVNGMGLCLGESETAIQPLIIGDANQALRIADALRAQGLWVTAIRPPTVPKGTARLRITLTAAHQLQDIDRLCDALEKGLSHA